MKKIYRKEEGVSPVIATILMVAITVVLAATVYIMVSGIVTPTGGTIQGSLMYDTTSSNIDKGYANFTAQISQPAKGISISKMVVSIDGHALGSSDYNVIDANNDNYLNTGDMLVIHSSYVKTGAKVIVGATGLSGSLQGTVGA